MEENEDVEQLEDKQEECVEQLEDKQEECYDEKYNSDAEESNSVNLKQQSLVQEQHRSIQVTCNTTYGTQYLNIELIW